MEAILWKLRTGATWVDSNGHPIDFEITRGKVHDSQVAPQLIELVDSAEYLVADKGYGSEVIRKVARNHNMLPVIPRRSNSIKDNIEFDGYLYQLRHLVENAFARLKHFKSIATRFDKLARNYKAMVIPPLIKISAVYCYFNEKMAWFEHGK